MDRHLEALAVAYELYASTRCLPTAATSQPQRLIERTIGLDDAAALLPHFGRATAVGMTMVNPGR